MLEEPRWEARLNIAGTLGTASAGTRTSSSTSTIRVDSFRSVGNAGVKSPTKTSSGERRDYMSRSFREMIGVQK